MQIYTRAYNPNGPDFERMWRLLQQDYARRHDNFVWLVSRFGDWKYGCWRETKFFPMFFRRHAQVWLDGLGEINGFVLSEDGENIFFIFTRPGFDHLYGAILDWTIANWGPRYPSLLAEVNEGQGDAIDTLLRRGFACQCEVATTRANSVASQAAEGFTLPEGYRIASIEEEPDFVGKRLVQVNAFRGLDKVQEIDLLAYEYSRESDAYDPHFDLSVVAPDGRHAASCVGFVDPANNVAEIERICTHADYRQRGYAFAVVRACFQQLHARGYERAYITGYSGEANSLYEKLGPVNHSKWFRYELRKP
jgi:GNAT superfamily N-acetyltransferase